MQSIVLFLSGLVTAKLTIDFHQLERQFFDVRLTLRLTDQYKS
jgi:hypothetical protein